MGVHPPPRSGEHERAKVHHTGGEDCLRDLLRLSSVPGVGPARLRSLLVHFGSAAAALQAGPRQLAAVEGVDKKTALSVARAFRTPDIAVERLVSDQAKRMKRSGARLITILDEEYPSNLKRIYDPPPFLFVRGDFRERDNPSVAVVGTRSPSSYGCAMASALASALAHLGVTVISGLARGIDTRAHAAALDADGRTVAVIGSGVDVVYPPENLRLAERIIHQGCILSEFLMGAKPDAVHFPQRNRVVSGITLGTVIVETGIEGGAMITARSALDQNREVFAVPSAVNAHTKSGANLLIREGRAMLIESVEDIVSELGSRLRPVMRTGVPTPPSPAINISLFERRILDAVGEETLHIDTIAGVSGLSPAEALTHLLSLEFKGLVRQTPGKMFRRS